MAEPDDYDDAMIDELMMNGGGEFGEPSAAELEMEFEMEFFGGNAQKAAPNNKPAAGAAEDGIDEFDEEAEQAFHASPNREEVDHLDDPLDADADADARAAEAALNARWHVR